MALKAGDLAPDLVFAATLSAGAADAWTSANLSGRLTVLAFYPATSSHNLRSTTQWNELVDQFADKLVQFVWITQEYLPPIGHTGWVFLDPLGSTAQSYGVEDPTAVIIGADRRILGFDRTMLPSANTLNAALEGDTEHLLAEPHRFDAYRPHLPPSETVHISPAKSESGTVLSGGPDHWAALGFTLKGLLMEVYGVHECFLDLAPGLDSDIRYDVELILPEAESRDQAIDRVKRAIEQQLRIDVSRRILSMDVYVLTAPDGSGSSRPFGDMSVGVVFNSSWQMEEVTGVPPALADLQSGAFLAQLVQQFPAIGRGFAHLGRFLPFSYGLLIVDDVEREGYHAIEISCMGRRTPEKLCQALWEDLGIVAMQERREVEMLVVRQSPTNSEFIPSAL